MFPTLSCSTRARPLSGPIARKSRARVGARGIADAASDRTYDDGERIVSVKRERGSLDFEWKN